MFLPFWSGSAGIPWRWLPKNTLVPNIISSGSSVVADRINKVQLACGSSVVAESTAARFRSEAVPQSLPIEPPYATSLLTEQKSLQRLTYEKKQKTVRCTTQCRSYRNAVHRQRKMRTARCLEKKVLHKNQTARLRSERGNKRLKKTQFLPLRPSDSGPLSATAITRRLAKPINSGRTC